jgi:hypothetical protein
MELKIEITDRARKYGYLYWTAPMDAEIKSFFGSIQKIDVWFNDSFLGIKNIDFTYRRISIGWKQTRALPKSNKNFVLSLDGQNNLRVLCR